MEVKLVIKTYFSTWNTTISATILACLLLFKVKLS